MINLLIGPPGGGKSYEAVVFHVLANLEQGRKVITNLPLVVEEFEKIIPGARSLIEFRNRQGKPGQQSTWAFGQLADYGDTWRHRDTNVGPLYVIDECHKALPRVTDKSLAPIEEWYAEHRHEGADVLLLTQSYGKVSKAITDQVQVCYRVKKKTLFGDSNGYIRKVQDGVRGDVISIAERVYEPRWFKLYKSHTKTEAAIIEADAKDVSPAFLKWKRAGYVILGLGSVGLAYSAYGFATKHHAAAPGAGGARTEEHAQPAQGAAASPGRVVSSPASLPHPGPQVSKTRRVIGAWETGDRTGYVLIYSETTELRIPIEACHSDRFVKWVCEVDGEIVSTTTGKAPPHDDGGGSVIGNLFNSSKT